LTTGIRGITVGFISSSGAAQTRTSCSRTANAAGHAAGTTFASMASSL
jgi:hypothetical protein